MSAQQLVGTPRLVSALVVLMSRAAPLLCRGVGGRRRSSSQENAAKLVTELSQLHGSVLDVLRTAGEHATVRCATAAVLRSMLKCVRVASSCRCADIVCTTGGSALHTPLWWWLVQDMPKFQALRLNHPVAWRLADADPGVLCFALDVLERADMVGRASQLVDQDPASPGCLSSVKLSGIGLRGESGFSAKAKAVSCLVLHFVRRP